MRTIKSADLLQTAAKIKSDIIKAKEWPDSDEVVKAMDDLSNDIIAYSNLFQSLSNDLENISFSIKYYPKKKSSKVLLKLVDRLRDII